MQAARKTLDENIAYFGYGYIKDPADLVPPIGLTFWSFRIMVGLGMYFIAFFGFICFLSWKRKLGAHRWLYYVALWTIPLGIISRSGRMDCSRSRFVSHGLFRGYFR